MISWPQSAYAKIDDFFLFPESSVYDYGSDTAHFIQKKIQEPDGIAYSSDGWIFSVTKEDDSYVTVIISRE